MWLATTRIPAAAAAAAAAKLNSRSSKFRSQLSAITTKRSLIQSSNDSKNDDEKKASKPLYLHMGPAGDCWTGHSLFAAKHLQPDYVRSIRLPDDLNTDEEEADIVVSKLIDAIDEDPALQVQIYDTGKIPTEVLEQARISSESSTST